MVNRITALKDVHILILKTHEILPYMTKKGFLDMIKLKILRWENPGLSRWAQCNHKYPYKMEIGISEFERDLRMLC